MVRDGKAGFPSGWNWTFSFSSGSVRSFTFRSGCFVQAWNLKIGNSGSLQENIGFWLKKQIKKYIHKGNMLLVETGVSDLLAGKHFFQAYVARQSPLNQIIGPSSGSFWSNWLGHPYRNNRSFTESFIITSSFTL